ncbi:MAG: hypothetical protein HC836_16850 [Richelia sp. RM2_1_2]|nr:hypothetical protein [Richelia sp. RM2_1_2]
MNQRTQQTIQKLSRLAEEFGFDVGMHNACYIEAVQKRIQRYGDNTDEFYESLLGLITTRIKYLKNKSNNWYIENPNHHKTATHLIDRITTNTNNLGTIIAIKNDKTFNGAYGYFLKVLETPDGWVNIYNLQTKDDIITAELTSELVNIISLINNGELVFLVHDGISANKLVHLTDLEVLPLDSIIETPNGCYTKDTLNVWQSTNSADKVNTLYFIQYLKSSSVKLG